MTDTINDMTLWYGNLFVANIINPVCSDATWYATFHKASDFSDTGELSHRIAQYIEFCVDWNERVKSDLSNPPEAEEFNQYIDLLSSQKWFAKNSDGQLMQILDAPVFFPDNEITWHISNIGHIQDTP